PPNDLPAPLLYLHPFPHYFFHTHLPDFFPPPPFPFPPFLPPYIPPLFSHRLPPFPLHLLLLLPLPSGRLNPNPTNLLPSLYSPHHPNPHPPFSIFYIPLNIP
ncbi:hypothetical protein, partial [Micrococcus luteus]|uniref:hypothetical protein n=1 Tax=Micrococcus luteus TaxID=1270 RepID=UPI001C92C670